MQKPVVGRSILHSYQHGSRRLCATSIDRIRGCWRRPPCATTSCPKQDMQKTPTTASVPGASSASRTSSIRPRAPQPRPRHRHPERRREAREEHSMSMWETPEIRAGPAGGDDIALTTPVSAAALGAAAPGPAAAADDTCPTCGGTRAGQDRPLRDLRRGGMGQASR